MSPPTPSFPLTSVHAERAWQEAYASAVAHGLWEDHLILELELFARTAGAYIEMAIGSRLSDHVERDGYRLILREIAFQWYLVDAEEPPPLRSDGLDPDIARVCGLSGTVN